MQSAPNEIAPGELNRPGLSCVWCHESTKFDMPEAPPEGLQATVVCENCGKNTPIPDVMFNPPAGDGAAVEVNE